MNLCPICGQVNGHRLNCPDHDRPFTVPDPERPYTDARYVRDLQREIVAYEAQLATLKAENKTLREMLAARRGRKTT